MISAIFLCDRSGVAARPWAEAGAECWCVDVQHSIRRNRSEAVGTGVIHFVWGDVRSWCPPRQPTFLMAFPPCTDVSVSGARDFKTKGLRKLTDALDLFNACQQAAAWSGAPYAIENPVGVLSSHVREPDQIFQPWQYGDNYSKATCLWTGNGFVMPCPSVTIEPADADLFDTPPLATINPDDIKETIWRMPPSPERADLRAVTPEGFARAVFMANAPAELTRKAGAA